MNEKTKESKFLDAITQYAEKQKDKINKEVEEYKAQKIEQATRSGLQDAYDLIQRDITTRKAAIVTETSQKELSIRSSVFEERGRICDEIFKRASKKIVEYTNSPEYSDYLIRSAQNICNVIGKETKCIVYIREADMKYHDSISAVISNAEYKADNSIKLGGIKAAATDSNILIDSTLDTALNDQRDWFVSNSGLKVV